MLIGTLLHEIFHAAIRIYREWEELDGVGTRHESTLLTSISVAGPRKKRSTRLLKSL